MILLLIYGNENASAGEIYHDKKVCIPKQPYFNFSDLYSLLIAFDYLIYLDDSWDYTRIINDINASISYIEERQLDQLIYTKNGLVEKRVYNIYNSITKGNRIFKNLSIANMRQDSGINYKTCADRNFALNIFRLIPSIIRIKNFVIRDFDLIKNEHMEFLYGQKLEENGFKVEYMNTDIEECKKRHILYDNRDGENITIVSGYLVLDIKRPPKKNSQIYDYIDKAKSTLLIPQKMVLYVSDVITDIVKKIRDDAGLMDKTRIISISKEKSLYMYDKLDKIKENVRKNVSPYDIAEYILAVNSRYGYLKDAIEKNYFGTDYFAWVDFSAGHIVDIPKNMKITYSQHEKVRIAWIGRYTNGNFIYNHFCLGGGVFLGYKTVMKELIRLHDEKFKELMDMGYNINDDKLLFTIMERYPSLFDTYFSGYKNLYTRA